MTIAMLTGLSAPLPSPLRGRTEVGGASQVFSDLLQYPVSVLHHIVIPKPQNNETLIAEPNITLSIIFCVLRVLSAVELNDHSFPQTRKIDNVASQWLLPTEFATVNLPVAKFLPQQLLGIGRVFSQLARACSEFAHTPYPILSPQGGKESRSFNSAIEPRRSGSIC